MPKVILWAWERPSDLRFIDPNKFGVAFLARTVRLSAGDVTVRPRLQSLNLPEGTQVVAVARIETDSVNRPELSKQQAEDVAEAIAAMSAFPNVSTLQIDFDALKSERSFYRDVIFDVRRRLPDNVGLSITALGSWCTYDDWLADLPIDEAVPMLFRMGPDGKGIRSRLDDGRDFAASLCRRSYGLSTDERPSTLSSMRRLYIFNPDAWTERSVRALLESTK
ncbi:MAG TPA: hypothetical protein VIU10_08720 [Candidatus Udaeobacter sp.]